jgi:two-component system LytT family response regulator
MINAVIIEDEAIYMDDLTKKLNKLDTEINIVSKITNGAEALNILLKINFDLLFLDIELGDMTAFDLIEKLKRHDFSIIFVTAFEQYAIKAFKVNAVDYLLKPVNGDELKNAVDKVMQQDFTQDKKNELLTDYHLFKSRKLLVPEKESLTIIHCDNLYYCESDGNYTKIIFDDNGNRSTVLTSKNLMYYDKKLSGMGFLRISQSFLVNGNKIKKILKKDRKVVLQNGESLPVSKRCKNVVVEYLRYSSL